MIFKADDELIKDFRCSNPTAAGRKVLEHFGIKIKGRSVGSSFYGLHKREYLSKINYDDTHKDQFELNFEDLNVGIKETVADLTLTTSHSCRLRTSNWVGVVAFGNRIYDNCKYIKQIGNSTIYIQPGYHSVRSVKVDNKFINLHLTIEKSANGPLYRAYTEKDPIINHSSNVIGQCVNGAFLKLKIE